MTALAQPFRSLDALVLLIVLALGCLPAHGADQHWNLISSDHFSVLTDAGSPKGHEIAARFEQMRAVFGELLMRKQVRMAEPIEIIAVASTAEYSQLTPSTTARAINSRGFFLPGEDRIFLVLNAADPDCWRAIEYQLAHYFLNYNYPPTQPWFDEGIARYFSSLYFTAQKTELGSDPDLPPPGQPFEAVSAAGTAKSLTEILQQTPWLNLPDLLATKRPAPDGDEGTHPTIFEAQSWILIHYLIAKDKLSETGAYFGLVELQRIPVAQSVQQAFGMSVAQLDSAVKDYFHSFTLAPALLDPKQRPANTPQSPNESPLPFSPDDVGVS